MKHTHGDDDGDIWKTDAQYKRKVNLHFFLTTTHSTHTIKQMQTYRYLQKATISVLPRKNNTGFTELLANPKHLSDQ